MKNSATAQTYLSFRGPVSCRITANEKHFVFNNVLTPLIVLSDASLPLAGRNRCSMEDNLTFQSAIFSILSEGIGKFLWTAALRGISYRWLAC